MSPVSSTKHATLRYTALRLGIFVGCLVAVAVLAYAGILPEGLGKSNPLWILLLALVVSAPLSLVLLRGQRAAMSAQIADGVDRAKGRLAAHRSVEDEDDTAAAEAAPAERREAERAASESA